MKDELMELVDRAVHQNRRLPRFEKLIQNIPKKQRPKRPDHMENLKKLCPYLREPDEEPPKDGIVKLSQSRREVKEFEQTMNGMLELTEISEVSETVEEESIDEDNFLRQFIEAIDIGTYTPQVYPENELRIIQKIVGQCCSNRSGLTLTAVYKKMFDNYKQAGGEILKDEASLTTKVVSDVLFLSKLYRQKNKQKQGFK